MSPKIEQNSCDELLKRSQVRKIKPTKKSVSGRYAFRGQTAIPFESTLERDFIIRCEFHSSVLDIIAQPAAIPFYINGRKYTYTPDFLVYYRLGSRPYTHYPKPMLVEVKPETEWRLHWREWFPKWKAARRYAIKQGWKFRIFDESRIRDTALANIRYLERYARMAFDSAISNQILNTVSEMGGCKVDYLLSRHFSGIYRDQGLANIWYLIATKKLECDILIPLSPSTEIWVLDYDQ